MTFLPMQFLLLSSAELDTAEPATLTVVLTGLSLVFFILILLTVILTIEGKVFASLDKSKKEKAAEAAAMHANAMHSMEQEEKPVAPVIEEGIPPEVVAAIAAAIASMEGGRYSIRSVSTAKTGRGPWNMAGVLSDTKPF